MAKFIEPPRTGKVMGNDVIARPVPFERLREMQQAGANGDAVAVVERMVEVINEYVTLADETPIDTSELSGAAIQKLYTFATDVSGGSAADFT